MFHDNIHIKGSLKLILRDHNGRIKERRNLNNLIVTTGKNWIASRLKDETTQMSYMGIGEGDTAPVIGDTNLENPLIRVLLTPLGGVVLNNTITYTATFGNGIGTGAITEAGIFTASTAGTMLCRTVFLPMNKASTDSLSIQWIVTII